MVGEGVMDGVGVTVDLKVSVNVGVNESVKVKAGTGVFVHEAAAVVSAFEIDIACCSEERAHADNRITTRNTKQ